MNPPFDLATVEAPFFAGLVGQKYLAHSADAPGRPPLELELLSAQPFQHRVETGERAPFSLFFKTGAPLLGAQGTYECTGPGLDAATPLFLVPVRDPLQGLGLEAVFN